MFKQVGKIMQSVGEKVGFFMVSDLIFQNSWSEPVIYACKGFISGLLLRSSRPRF